MNPWLPLDREIRVLIADDHPVVRQGIKSFLSRHTAVRVIGEAADGEEALDKALTLAPDIVLLDICMPKLDGLAVIQALRLQAPQIKILVLSMHNSQWLVLRIIEAGAHGYVSKEAPTEELSNAIQAILAGKTFFTSEMLRSALNWSFSGAGQLSPRERAVLGLIADGKTNKEIAHQLRVGLTTTATYRKRLLKRLNLHSVAELTRFAIASGISALEQGRDADGDLTQSDSVRGEARCRC